MRALVLIKIVTGEIQYAYRDLKRVRSIAKAHLTFGPFDAIAELEVKDLNELGKIVALEIQPIPGVTQTLTCVMAEVEQPDQAGERLEEHKPILFAKN